MPISARIVPGHPVIRVGTFRTGCEGESGTDGMSSMGQGHDLVLSAGLNAFNVEVNNVGDGHSADFAILGISNGNVSGAEVGFCHAAEPLHWTPHVTG